MGRKNISYVSIEYHIKQTAVVVTFQSNLSLSNLTLLLTVLH